MSEPQTETDVEPTPGPWELDEIAPSGLMKPIFVESGDATICAMAAFLEPNSHVDPKEALANARLIANAGSAAQEAREMGYDPVAAVGALPNGLQAARKAIIDLQEAHTDGPPEDSAEAAAQAASHRLKVFMAEAGADEPMIPGDASVALVSAEGSDQ